MPPSQPIRAVIYARYSSENQSETSLDDQVRLCRERIAAEGWLLQRVYRDAAISGASAHLRPNYQAMLEADRPRYWEHRTAQHVLTGKVVCGSCGNSFAAVGRDYLACTTARKQGVCGNRKGIRRSALEHLILDALRNQLMAPELVADFVADYTAEWNRLVAEKSASRTVRERELAGVQKKLTGLINAIADGFRAPGLQAQLDDMEDRKVALEAELAARSPMSPKLDPNLAAVYRERVTALHDALHRPDEGRAALEAVRGLIERVVISPAAAGDGLEIELVGAIAAMVRLALPPEAKTGAGLAPDRGLLENSAKVVAGIGFEPMTFRL